MTSSQHPKRVDDFIVMGRYVVYVCILAEFMIIPQIGSMFYMVFAGVAPSIISCNGYQFDPKLENKEVCLLIKNMNNCTEPQLNYQFKSVNVEWTYICDSSKMVKNSISIQMFGVLLGSVVFGQISDSFGRKLGMLVSLIGTLLGWLLVAQSVELTQFTITRTIVGFFTGGSIAWVKRRVLNVFIMENIPKKHRMWINMAITWSPNLPPIALFAWISHSWDKLAYANALICVPPLLFCMYVYDS
uniref:MFS domain-containing protein n=1 Tax=Heterorhabditis bacteriophora TaxID=37862 RepID=A0A1I7XHT0_HETBA